MKRPLRMMMRRKMATRIMNQSQEMTKILEPLQLKVNRLTLSNKLMEHPLKMKRATRIMVKQNLEIPRVLKLFPLWTNPSQMTE